VECGGVWWSVVECGGVWWSVVECGGVWWSEVEEGTHAWRHNDVQGGDLRMSYPIYIIQYLRISYSILGYHTVS
jgi:hypothetical protein